MNRQKKYFLLLSILCILFSACKNSHKIIAIDPRFAQYIAGYTSGMLSNQSHIRIELSKPIAHPLNGLPDSTLLDGAFSFSPSIKGHAIWVNERTIEFIPKTILDKETFYNATFKLARFTSVEKDLKKFHFQFSTYEQHLFVTLEGLHNIDNYNVEWQRLEGKIKTTDKDDTASLKKTIEANYLGKKLAIKWENEYNSDNEIRFSVDSIARQSTESKISITWNGKAIDAKEFGSQELTVSALGDYTVHQLYVKDEEDQHLEIEFSEPLLPNQNLNGIVKVGDVENVSFAIDGNMLKVFFTERIVGLKEIRISTAIKNCKGYKMKSEYRRDQEFFAAKPKVRIVGSGCILPNSQGLIFPFETINLKSVQVRVIKIFENNVQQFLQVNDLNGNDGLTRVGKIVAEKKFNLDYNKQDLTQWTKHVIDLQKLIQPDPGSIYRVSIKFERADAILSCDTSNAEEDELNEEPIDMPQEGLETKLEKNWNEDNWNDNSFDDYETYEGYNDDYTACDNSYYQGKAVSRNILASDIGLIFKLDENKMAHAFVSNMITTDPMPKTRIEFFDYAKQLIAAGNTDMEGKLDIFLPQKPFLMVAKNGKQRGYMKLLDANANALSKFDIEGEVVQKGIKGFLYTERGVWRPGDSIYINFILEDKQHQLPENHPVSFVFKDPMGKSIYQTIITQHVNHTYDCRTATSPNAVTGNYVANVKVGNLEFTKNIHIETVKPNRLKINFDTPPIIYENNKDKGVLLQAKWLHGADAKNLKANVYATVRSTETKFDHFPDYIFSSPLKNYNSNDIVLFDSALDANGSTHIPCNLHIDNNAPGMLKASFVTKVFEEGGDFSIDKNTCLYSPFKRYVGLQLPNAGDPYSSLLLNRDYVFHIASVNQFGTPEDASKLHLKIYKIEWRWWYETDQDDASTYLSKSGTIVVKDTILKSINGKSLFNFIASADNYARYLFVVTDEEGGHETGAILSFDSPYWQAQNSTSTENATMLHFSCDKTKYMKGEQVKVTIPSASKGTALVSIESGNKVIKSYWIKTTVAATKFNFIATTDMSPNVYLHVTMIQPHANTLNDLPIRMYGVVPIQVDDPNTHLHPVISMPNELRPETTAHIDVKELTGKKMTYTLAIVDNGLLDLTKFKTPNAWSTFYAKEALGVKTWDMYDNVIGAYAGKLDHLLSIGGDANYDGSNTTKANRFKPMTIFVGPFTIEANQHKTHAITIPNYVGSVRVMVVAQNNGAYGEAEKNVEIKKPLMVLATVPRVLSPNEMIHIPVDVFAMKENIKDVKIELESNDLLQWIGNKQQFIHFNKIGDEIVPFTMKVASKIGMAKIIVKATCGNEIARQEIELDIRMPNPPIAVSQELSIQANETMRSEIQFKNIKGTNEANIELSCIPPINVEGRLSYLIQYPHGCIEQTTSSAFPQLYISHLMELSDKQQKQTSINIQKALRRLQLFQTSNGGFSYWPGENESNEYGSNYAGHFMLEAEKLGYALAPNLKSSWVKYQTQQAKNWTTNNGMYPRSESNELIQAYRLYTLALSGNAELGSMNRLREENNLCTTAKCELALAYQAIGQIEVAKQLTTNISMQFPVYKELSYSYGSDTRDKAILIETFSKLNNQIMVANVVKELSDKMNSNNWFSTQETAYLLMAFCDYYGLSKTNEINISYQLNNGTWISKQSTKSILKLTFNENDIASFAPIQIKNNGKVKLYAKLITKGVPMIGDTSISNKHISMQVIYKTMKGVQINPSQIKQGTDFYAEVTIQNLDKTYLKEMCLNEIFPSGWEIHNSRMDEEQTQNNTTRYQDIRDDRVYSYYDLTGENKITVKILLNATYVGKFYMPSIYSEAMYDNTIHANSKPMWVEVVQ